MCSIFMDWNTINIYYTNMRKQKVIHLSEGAIKALSIQAINAGTNFKNYVEGILERTAVKAVRQKRTK